MPLGGGGTDEFLSSELGDDLVDVLGAAGDFFGDVGARAGKDAFDTGGVAYEDDGVAGDAGAGGGVELQEGDVSGRRIELEDGDVGFGRNLVEIGAVAVGLAGEKGAIRENVGGGAVIGQLLEVVVLPPRLGDMVVGDDAAVAGDEEAGAEDIDAEVRAGAFGVELDHALFVDAGLAGGVSHDADGFAGSAIEKFDDNVKQADAGAVIVNDGFGNFAFVFEKLEAALRVGELPAKGSGVGAFSGSHFLPESFGFGFEGFARGGVGA